MYSKVVNKYTKLYIYIYIYLVMTKGGKALKTCDQKGPE